MAGWMVIAQGNQYQSGDGFPQDAANKVADLVRAGYGLRNVIFAPDGHWLILLENNAYWHNGVSSDLTTALGNLAAAGFQNQNIEFAPDGGWIIVCANNGYYGNIPQAAFDAIGAGVRDGRTLKNVVFTPKSEWLVVFDGNQMTKSANFPADCSAGLAALIQGGATIDDVAFSVEGNWAITAENGYYLSGNTGGALAAAEALADAGHAIREIAFSIVDVTVPAFPITADRRDDFAGCGGHMDTSVTIDDQGRMNAVTHIWEDTALRGFHGGAVVVLVDASNHMLWASPTEVLGVDGRWLGVSDRTVNWTATVPGSLLSQARGIAIKQLWDPTDAAGVIAKWLTSIATDVGQIASIVKSVATIVKTI